ncbi:hypothetical protein [Halomonas sp. PBN3]|uniref:hypothetical protein n=1 Tax=Halomonas sp. PBN3 TaxID=1397528 RepID=UPI0003B89EB3|nr:hypothetical protein [Halomonas sp. PBN3]ERS88844.1 hypothetical protein Q671_07995 [Halomonas sp. PBN3]
MAVKKVTDLRPLDGGGEPPDMEQRLRHLEQEVHTIRETMATRQDLAGEAGSLRTELYKALNAQTWKIIGLMGVMTGLFTVIVKWL